MLTLFRGRCGPAADTPDEQLLRRYTETGEETAFAALVARHGPMVLGVCRRLLDVHAAEDAFQTTFLILVHKAKGIKQPGLLGNWLYGVAYRVAVRLRAKQRSQPLPIPTEEEIMAQDEDVVSQRELESVIDEEIHRLPEHYRRPLVLCCLEGRSYAEAAGLLHCSAGTLKSRLARARDQLHRRLRGRGWRVAGVALAMLLTPECLQAAVPPQLELAAVGRAGTGGAKLSVERSRIDDLAAEILRSGTAAPKVWLLAGFLTLVLLGIGIWGLGQPAVQEEEPAPPEAAAQAMPPKAVAPLPQAKLKVVRLEDCFPKVHAFEKPVRAAAINGVGHRLAVLLADGALEVRDALNRTKLAVIPGQPGDLSGLALSHDGRLVATVSRVDGSLKIFAVATGQAVQVLKGQPGKTPAPAAPVALSANGRWAVSTAQGNGFLLWDLTAHRLQVLATTAPTAGQPVAFSPDSKELAVAESPGTLALWDLAAANPQRRWAAPAPGTQAIAFAAAGQQLASAGSRKSLRLWDVTTGKLVRSFGGPDGTSSRSPISSADSSAGYHTVGFVKLKNWLLAGSGQTIDVWDLARGEKVRLATSFGAPRHCMSCNMNGSLVTALRGETTVLIWATGQAEVLPIAPRGSTLLRRERR